MAAQDCIDAIKAAAGDLSDEEVTEILEILQARAKARQAAGQAATLDQALLDEADNLAADLEVAALIEKRNRAINVVRRFELESFVEQVDALTGDPSLGLSAANVGINARLPRARASADAKGHALITEYLGGLVAGLRREGVLAVFNSRLLEREIARELAELSKPAGAARPGLSGSREAQTIAQVIDKIRRAAVARENRAGAFIRPLAGYVVRQSHDMHKIRRAGFTAWRDAILPLLDVARSFQGADPEDFLKGAFDGLQSGRHIVSNGAEESDLSVAFKGPGNLAKRISQHRVLHFKDADAWFDYNQAFGRGSLSDALVHELERAARNTALMETWGTNPRNLFENLLAKLKDQHRADPKKLARLERGSLLNQFDEVEGITRVPLDPSLAKVTSIVLAVETLSKLGGAAISSFGDLGFKALEIARGGDNLLTVWGKNLESSLEGLAPGARREVAELIGVGLEGQIGDLAARFMAQDDIPGRVAKVQQLFFKLNLLGPWTDANKRGLGLMFARELAMKKTRSWGQLDPAQQELLGLYGIGPREWDVARQATRKAADGREYLMPDAIEGLEDGALRALLRDPKASARKLRKARDEIATALRAYYVDRVDNAVPTPGARERAFLKQGTRPGTPAGIAFRLVGQFKAFPVTVATRVLGRLAEADTTGQFFRNLASGKGDILGLAHMVVATTVLGYVAQSAKEITKGRSPRDPSQLSTWNAALLQGGGLGIYGDFLFGETNRFGRSLTETLAGPTISDVSELKEIIDRLRAGEDAGAAALRFGVGVTPFANLFYTRIALDYLILFQLQEAINPGFLKRMERRIQRENKQTFILPPSRAIPRGGGDRILEGVRE